MAKTDSTRSVRRNEKQRRNQNGTAYGYSRDYNIIWKVLAVSFIPLFFVLLIKSSWFKIQSFQENNDKLVEQQSTSSLSSADDEGSRISSEDPVDSLFRPRKENPTLNKDTEINSNAPLRIQIASDLHIEFFDEDEDLDFLIEPKAPILALLGDVGYACTRQLRKFLLSQCGRFEEVWFLAGNHEYYNKHGTRYSVTEQNAWLQQVASERPNLKYLEKAAIPILNGSFVVLATTLWSDIPDNYLEGAELFLNDYNLSYNHAPSETTPRLLRATETRQWYQDNLNWLQTQLQTIMDQNKLQAQQPHPTGKLPQTKVVVLTHHTPLMTGTSAPQYKKARTRRTVSRPISSRC